jgi:hypothetical protein
MVQCQTSPIVRGNLERHVVRKVLWERARFVGPDPHHHLFQ